ncbi:MAG: hypothetical protein GXY06_06520 [Clostridiaceae bacterium]|nr:hypothetical protein [Clostridiaceae bacterium]
MDKFLIKIKRRFNGEAIFTDFLVFVILMVNLISVGSTLVIYIGGSFTQSLILYFVCLPAILVFFFRRLTFSLSIRFVCYSAFATIASLIGLSGGQLIAIVSFLILFIVILISFSRHYRAQFSITTPLEMFIFILVNHFSMSILASYIRSRELFMQLFLHAICCICLFFAARQYHVFTTQYAHLSLSPTQPSAIVKKNHLKTILSLALFGIVGAPLILTLPYDKISHFLNILTQKAFALLSLILLFLRRIGVFPEGDIFTPQEYGENGVAENNLLAKIFENLFYIITIVLFSLIVIASIRGIVVYIVKMHLRGKASDEVNTESIVHDHVEKIYKRSRHKRLRHDFGKGEERKIRREFYHRVKKSIRDGAPIRKSDTSAEMRKKISGQDEKSLESLIKAYEKARYS